MKKCLKKLFIIVLAVVCACSIHITVNAESDDAPNNWGSIGDLIGDIIDRLNPDSTTNPAETTTADPNTGTTVADPNATTTDPINNMGTGTVPSTENKTNYPTIAPDDNNPAPGELTTVPFTTEPFGEEDSSYRGSLADLLEDDSAAIIVQAPTETFTLNAGLVVNDGNSKDEFTWQQAALIAAAVLFVILAALVGALLVQRSKRIKEEEEDKRRSTSYSSSSSGHVPVEVMTPERIAELLGSAANASRVASPSSAPSGNVPTAIDVNNMTSEESAAAIKAAILMGQLSHSYSDPLIRKYTEEPVMISPVSKVNLDDGVTGAQILEATDSMLDDITGNEKFASDVSGMKIPADDIETILIDVPSKTCPECQGAVASGDVFCHSCGAYVG